MTSGVSSYAENVDNTMLFIVGVSVVLLVGITAVMIYFVIKYNRKRHPKAKQIEGNIILEILWIGIPTILVLVMFWYGFQGYYTLRATTDYSMVVNVSAKMWDWKFTYPNGLKTDTLYIPVNRTTRLDMKSQDVNHSFYIPAFRLKEDVIASRTTYLILQPDKIGAYDVACAEYCGLRHSAMYSKVVVMPEKKFDNWYETTKPEDIEAASSAPNMTILNKKICVTCHSFDGSKLIGPSFTELGKGKATVITGGMERVVTIDDEYLRRSILEPNADIVKGFQKNQMPVQKYTDEELDEIINLLKTTFMNNKNRDKSE